MSQMLHKMSCTWFAKSDEPMTGARSSKDITAEVGMNLGLSGEQKEGWHVQGVRDMVSEGKSGHHH